MMVGMSTGETWTLGHRPALDGLRGIAILLVVVAHSNPRWFGGLGTAGVTMFFTLSGFLITSLLLEEHARHGRISLTGFYWRRLRRLGPALVAFLAGIWATAQILSPGAVTWRHIAPVLLYAENWVVGLEWREPGWFTSHTWSLSVEEQFYLVWPLLMIAALRWFGMRVLVAVSVIVTVYAVVARFVFWDGGTGHWRVYMGSDTRADALLAGCLLAIALHRGWSSRVMLAPALVGFAFAVSLLTGAAMYLVAPALVPFATAAWIARLMSVTAPPWLTSRALVLVGRRSYALYLWHVPILAAGVPWASAWLPTPIAAVAMVAASWVMASLSWRFIEEPFMRRRSEVAEPPNAVLLRGGGPHPAHAGIVATEVLPQRG